MQIVFVGLTNNVLKAEFNENYHAVDLILYRILKDSNEVVDIVRQ